MDIWFIFLRSGSLVLLEHEISSPIDTQDPTCISSIDSGLEGYGSLQESVERRECLELCLYIESSQASPFGSAFAIQ